MFGLSYGLKDAFLRYETVNLIAEEDLSLLEGFQSVVFLRLS